MAVEQTIEGVNANPFRIIQGTLKMGPDAISVANTSASNGVVAQVFGPNKTIMDTGYFPANELLGPVRVEVVYYSTVAGSNKLQMDIWRKHSNGYEEIIKTLYVGYNADIAPYFGMQFGRAVYSQNYQYRYVIKTYSTVSAATVIGIDYIKITTTDVYGISAPTQYGNSGEYYGNPMDNTFDPWIGTDSCAGNPSHTQTFTTSYDCTDAIITISTQSKTDMILANIWERTSTGFKVYIQPAGGGNFIGNCTIHAHVAFQDPMEGI